MPTRELLLGCGSRRLRNIQLREGQDREFGEGLVTLDINADHNPDVVHDLNILPYPFEDNWFDEIHAYEVMEHVGQQGDWRFFFAQWSEIWRILKPDGQFYGTSPLWHSPWAWGDPGHTRVIQAESLVFLSQEQYHKQIGQTPMTDYRFCYKADFEPLAIQPVGDVEKPVQMAYVLQAKKPARSF